MKNVSGKGCPGGGMMFYGAATVGERGQIVIPAEARNELGFLPGEKLLIMRHPGHEGIMVFKLEGVRAYLDEFQNQLQQAESVIASSEAANAEHA